MGAMVLGGETTKTVASDIANMNMFADSPDVSTTLSGAVCIWASRTYLPSELLLLILTCPEHSVDIPHPPSPVPTDVHVWDALLRRRRRRLAADCHLCLPCRLHHPLN